MAGVLPKSVAAILSDTTASPDAQQRRHRRHERRLGQRGSPNSIRNVILPEA